MSDLEYYAWRLVVWDQYGCCLDLEVRRDKVLWILEQEFPEVSSDERYNVMMRRLPDECERREGGYSNTPQVLEALDVGGKNVT